MWQKHLLITKKVPKHCPPTSYAPYSEAGSSDSLLPMGYKKFYVSFSDQSIEQRCEFSTFLFPLYDEKIRNVWHALKNVNIKLLYDPAIALLDTYPEERNSGTQTDTCVPIFTAVLPTIAKRWEKLKCSSTCEQINKMWYTNTMEYYQALTGMKVLIYKRTNIVLFYFY